MSKGNLTLLQFPEAAELCKGFRELAEYYQEADGTKETSALVLVKSPDGEIGYYFIGSPIMVSEAHGLCTWVAADIFLQSQLEE